MITARDGRPKRMGAHGEGKGGSGGSSWVDDRVEALTRQIAQHAQSKELDAAKVAFASIAHEGFTPNKFAYAAMINAHITSGDLPGAMAMLRKMEAAGIPLNNVVLTTLLKGHCAVGDLEAARALLCSMSDAKVAPDVRTLNTFMRGCVRAGDLGAAQWAFRRLPEWNLTPGVPATVAMGRLLCQGLRLRRLRKLLAAHTERGSSPAAHAPKPPRVNPCMFWERGQCSRGLNCHFWHDPSIVQLDQRATDAAHRDAELEMQMQLAQAAALLGRSKACKRALRRAGSLHCAAEAGEARRETEWWGGGGGGGGGSGGGGGEGDEHENRYGTGLHAAFRRAELKRDAVRIRRYLRALRRQRKGGGEGGGK